MSKLKPVELIKEKILFIRSKNVMLNRDLSMLYGVKTIALRQQVKRNVDRFPEDFMFQLNKKEVLGLVSQNVIPHVKYFGGALPYVFTEQGVAMLSSVLRSKKAIEVNIAIMRVFVQMRDAGFAYKELAATLKKLGQKVSGHDKDIRIFLRQFMRSS